MRILVSDWIDEDHCSLRCIAGTDHTIVANRVAFIEKTPRVRVAPDSGNGEDYKNWYQGPKGCADDGHDADSRHWCDIELVRLGYQLPEVIWHTHPRKP